MGKFNKFLENLNPFAMFFLIVFTVMCLFTFAYGVLVPISRVSHNAIYSSFVNDENSKSAMICYVDTTVTMGNKFGVFCNSALPEGLKDGK